jgi:hypothetical protein
VAGGALLLPLVRCGARGGGRVRRAPRLLRQSGACIRRLAANLAGIDLRQGGARGCGAPRRRRAARKLCLDGAAGGQQLPGRARTCRGRPQQQRPGPVRRRGPTSSVWQSCCSASLPSCMVCVAAGRSEAYLPLPLMYSWYCDCPWQLNMSSMAASCRAACTSRRQGWGRLTEAVAAAGCRRLRGGMKEEGLR